MYKSGGSMNKRKRDVLKAASIVFAKYGYRGATMDEIALEAGVVKGTLYYNFKNNKGYPTKDHIEAIKKYGIIKEHRISYHPVSEYINKK